MRSVGAFEAKNRLGQLLDRVERGEEVTITRHGKEVARLVPVRPGFNRDKARAAVRRLRERAEQRGFGRFDWAEWKSFRDQGRPRAWCSTALLRWPGSTATRRPR